MANTSFLDFNSQNAINSGDYLVGYNAAGTGEIRVPINVGLRTANNTLSVVGSLSALNFINVSYKTEYNYLAAANTYVSLFTVPNGYRFAVESLTCTIDNAVGTYTTGTAPTISVISGTVYSTGVRLTSRSFGTTTINTGTYIKSSGATSADDYKTAASGNVISVINNVVNNGTSYTVLSGTVIVSGYLY